MHSESNKDRSYVIKQILTPIVMAVTLVLGASWPAMSFETDLAAFVGQDEAFHGGSEVHEQITREAIFAVTPLANAVMIEHIVHGNQNADLTHKFEWVFHINSANVINGEFDNSFQLIRRYVDEAIEKAQGNAAFLNPEHVRFGDLARDVKDSLGLLSLQCIKNLSEPAACRTVSARASATVGDLSARSLPYFLINQNPDPHAGFAGAVNHVSEAVTGILDPSEPYCRLHLPGTQKYCFTRLDDMLTGDTEFQETVRHLRTMQQEIRGYYAWQALGHAFHITQDFFAHSNFVELVNGQVGPPCNLALPALCGQPVTGVPVRYGDQRVGRFLDLVGFNAAFNFNLATLQAVLGASFPRLQTGYVRQISSVQPAQLADFLVTGDMCPKELPLGFEYCHWEYGNHPALNKDSDKDTSKNPAHANFWYARQLAVYVSIAMWEHFMVRAGFAPPPTVDVAPVRVTKTSAEPPPGVLRALRERMLKNILPIILEDEEY
jgi:hypothetical protein